jgi:hypothetical protein
VDHHHDMFFNVSVTLRPRALGRDDVVAVLQRSYDSDATAAKKVYALEEKLGSRQPV